MTEGTVHSPNDLPNAGRRTLLMMTGASLAAAGLVSIGAAPARAQATDEWDKTFPRSENVTQEKVTFTNRDSSALPALAVAGPFGAVKEQSAGLYAQTMAERGFVTLAFDRPLLRR